MRIELTEKERLLAQQGQPVDVIDPQTNEAYVLIAKPRFDEMRPSPVPAKADQGTHAAPEPEIPEGIRLSQEAFRRDLPELLKDKSLYHQWIAYHRSERIAIGRRQQNLIDQCFRRGLDDDDFYVGWIDICELKVDEEVEPRPEHFVERDHEDS